MDWLDALQELRSQRIPAVIVTLATVRGHAPRNGGAKMVVSPDTVHGTVGGGNLEQTAIDQARRMLSAGTAEPELLALTLSDKAVTEYGVQCCGGEVTMLLEPIRVTPRFRPTPALLDQHGPPAINTGRQRTLSPRLRGSPTARAWFSRNGGT